MKKSLITILIAAMILTTTTMPLSANAADEADAETAPIQAETPVEAAPGEAAASEPAPAQTPDESPSVPSEPAPEPAPAEESAAPEPTAAPETDEPAEQVPAEEPSEAETEPTERPGAAKEEVYVIPSAEQPNETPAAEPTEKPEDKSDRVTTDIDEPERYNYVRHIPYGGAVVSVSDADDEYDREENIAAVYAFLTEELELNTAAACGILANIAAASDFNPCVTNGRRTSFGIFQWSGSRAAELIRFCEWSGCDFHTLQGQLEFLRYELTGPRQYVRNHLLDLANDEAGAYEAAGYWCYHYQAAVDRAAEAALCGARAVEEFFPAYAAAEEAASAEAAEAAPETVFPFARVTTESVHRAYAAQAAAADEAAETAEEDEEPFAIDPSIGTGYFIHPVSYDGADNYGWRVHPIYGQWRFHSGMDIAVNSGDPIYAADNGTVILLGYDANGYGNYVVIDHNDGYQTLYAHQSSLAVSVGDVVAQGDVIGYVGATGATTGPHLHYEVWVEYETVDPISYMVSPSFEYNP